ncbi:MAG: TIGR04552 family protein [Bdellovibrionales bacterium]|jgi:uncharacterized protein (TIGR04562 family)|nr:TIGR04552 family protein [Bdellovibrionales bacterium]MBT3527099.1 TIGR04552 family protein [Bdellovibrionales bacterium]MBT7669796.1 TIGR04552 family protein [Bdellovibrionales bacterium]MBT7768257.1 TIGR04552 family protein [Bdellovibrionales bacterium]
MEKPSYLSKYALDWDLIGVIFGGESILDTSSFIRPLGNRHDVADFLAAYGLDPENPVDGAELFGHFQEAMKFIPRYFLTEGNPDGLDLKIPSRFYHITDISELFLIDREDRENYLWAEVILKVIHTVLHADKDLRSNYFLAIQTQIFDRFYKFIYRDDKDCLFLGDKRNPDSSVKLSDFITKARKGRDSVIIKLLHKADNVAEELFDRIGIRIVTESRFDVLRVANFLADKNIVIPHNIKPSRSVNTLINAEDYYSRYQQIIEQASQEGISEAEFLKRLEQQSRECVVQGDNEKNTHSSISYRSVHFTCRQLITYSNSFLKDFNQLRRQAKEIISSGENSKLADMLLAVDTSLITRDIRFFYPYEVQIVDAESHQENSRGEASHQEYKKGQLHSAMLRLFDPLIKFKEIQVP